MIGTPVTPSTRVPPAFYPDDAVALRVPPAFYRRDEPPLPPPDDPHWREWPHDEDDEGLPRWFLYGLPALLALVVLHALLILVVLNLHRAVS